MTEPIVTDPVRAQKADTVTVPGVFGYCFSLAGVMAACGICLFSRTPVVIERPAILLLASLFVLVCFGSDATRMLQKITCFYLVAVPVNELASQNFQVPLLSGVTVSDTVIVLLLCAAGFFLGRANSHNNVPGQDKKELLGAWIVALGIIIMHMALLAVVLKKFYGYGYEHDLKVLGSLCLYLLLFVFMWEKLANLRFRRAAALVLAGFYCAKTVFWG